MFLCSRSHRQYVVELKFQNSHPGSTFPTHNHHTELVKKLWHVKTWNTIFKNEMKKEYDDLTGLSKIYLNPLFRKEGPHLPFSLLALLLYSSFSKTSPQCLPWPLKWNSSWPEVQHTSVAKSSLPISGQFSLSSFKYYYCTGSMDTSYQEVIR